MTNDKIKILGSYSSYCRGLSEKYNFIEVINKLKTCLHVWKSRGLTLAGKILIFKTMALSKILYIATMKVTSELILDELDRIQKEFIRAVKDQKSNIRFLSQINLKEDIKVYTSNQSLCH